MRRVIIHLFVAIFTFSVSIAFTRLVNNPYFTIRVLGTEPLQSADSSPEEFISLYGLDINHDLQIYTTLTGQTVREETVCFESSIDAKREWEQSLKEASKIIERLPKSIDKSEEGKSVIAVFTNSDGTKHVQLMSYGGEKCYKIIDAPSLEIGLRFEDFFTRKH